jgi:uncharacterized protein (TIGR03437 family)
MFRLLVLVTAVFGSSASAQIANYIALVGYVLVLSAVVAPMARGQFSGLTTTNDGSEVWFASPLRLRGTDQYLWSKIFRIDANGAVLAAEVAQSSPVPPTNAYVLTQPQVTGDGTLLIYLGTLYCVDGSSCFLSEQHSSTLLNTTTGQATPVGPNASISRNGRYLASYSSGNVFGPQFLLTDRVQSTTVFQGSFAPETVSIAADGTTALTMGSSLQLIKGGALSTLVSSNITSAGIDDGAATILYETQAPRRLFVLNLNTMETRELGPDNRDSYQGTLSADGQWVAYLSTIGSTPQVFLSRIDGSGWRKLTAGSIGAVDVTLSGDGSTVFAITGNYSIVRIDAATGAITTLVGPTPTISGVQATTPGSLATVQGTGLANTSVMIAGVACPIFSRSDTSIVFQIPWEVPVSADSLTIPQGGAPYFDDVTPLDMGPFLPEAIPLAPVEPATGTLPIAIHTDFSSLVTDENPAAPGETVHIYLMGGGAVNPPVATGVVTPISPLSRITTPISVVAAGEPVQVSFFGLAPGTIGVWQMDAEVPSDWSRQYLSFDIEFNSPPPNPFGESVTQPAIPVKTGP